jgi:S-adenosylmethionine hydrolase
VETPGSLVALTTDFGTSDGYVGQMKGALLAIAPDARLVDLCHDLPPHDVGAAAFVLETAYAAFPEGTIHLVVVDPGVGTDRAAVAVATRRHRFVAPDNGVLSRVLARDPALRVHAITEPGYGGPRRTATFEGRDRFAPAAGWLARGLDIARLGRALPDLVRLPPRPVPLVRGVACAVRVAAVDRFGNVVLDVRREELDRVPGATPDARAIVVDTARGRVSRLCRTYADGPPGEPFLLFGSSDYLEIALDRGRAVDRLGLGRGDPVQVTVL